MPLQVDAAGFYNMLGFNDDTRVFLSIPARHVLERRIDLGFLAQLFAEHFDRGREAAGKEMVMMGMQAAIGLLYLDTILIETIDRADVYPVRDDDSIFASILLKSAVKFSSACSRTCFKSRFGANFYERSSDI